MNGRGSSLPEGHPAIPGMSAPIPEGATASLVVQVVQGTRGGPDLGEKKVHVELVRGRRPVGRLEATTSERGEALFKNIPLAAGLRPVAHVDHSGVAYRDVGPWLRPSPPDQRMMLVVYESTAKPPAWVIRARHVIVSHTDAGLYVKEMMVVENPTDRTWTGTPDAEGRGITIDIPLPVSEKAGVDFYAGFDRSSTRVVKDRLKSTQALAPGTAQFVFGYPVAVEHGGQATIRVASPATTDRLVVVLPNDGSAAEATGLEGGQAMQMGKRTMRLYQAEKLKAGDEVEVRLSGLAVSVPAEPVTQAPPRSHAAPQALAAVGGGAILAGGLGYACWKRITAARKADQDT
jgi:hypothetical protein